MSWKLTRRSTMGAAGIAMASFGAGAALAARSRQDITPAQTSPTSAQPTPSEASAAGITQPVPGVVMQPGYTRSFGQSAYVWGWPMVNMLNRNAALTQAPHPGRLNGVLPAAPRGRLAMLSDYIDPAQTFIACPNQDVVYGLSYMSLDEEPVIIQVGG